LTLVYGVDVPLIDQWSMPPLLEKSCAGTLTFEDLFRQYSDHRPLFPRLIMIGLARLSGWNVRWELATNLVLGTLSFIVLLVPLRRALAASGSRVPLWAPALFSLLTFSLCQWENWLWGGQIIFFLNTLCVSGGILVLWSANRARDFALATLLGVVATFSLANGLLFWWIGLFIIAAGQAGSRPRLQRLALWSATTLIVHLIYFHGYVPHAPAGERLNPVRSPLLFGHYVLTFLGSPAASFSGSAWPPHDSGVAAVVGFAGLVLFGAALQSARRRSSKSRRSWTPFAALGVYALFSGAAAAVGRGKFGIPQAMAPRYTTISMLGWIGLCGLLLVSTRATTIEARDGTPEKPWFRLFRLLPLAIAALFLVSSAVCIPVFPQRWRLLEPVRGALVEAGPDSLLVRLHPDVGLVRSGMRILEARKLSVFRDTPARLGIRAVAAPLKTFGQVLLLEEDLIRIRKGQHKRVRIRVTNPTAETWSALGDGTGVYSVRLSYHWLRSDGTVAVLNGERTLLSEDLTPGQTTHLNALVAPPPGRGRFLLVWTMVQEGVNWFDDAGAGALKVEVKVER
jgi:hypothetical protein